MNTPKTDVARVWVQLEPEQSQVGRTVYLIDQEVARQLETQVQELRLALQTIYMKTIDIDSRETARAILEKTK